MTVKAGLLANADEQIWLLLNRRDLSPPTTLDGPTEEKLSGRVGKPRSSRLIFSSCLTGCSRALPAGPGPARW
jgi:hypothetical protein